MASTVPDKKRALFVMESQSSGFELLLRVNQLIKNWPPPEKWDEKVCQFWSVSKGILAGVLYEILMNNMEYHFPVLWFFSLRPEDAFTPDPERIKRAPIWSIDPELVIQLYNGYPQSRVAVERWVETLPPPDQHKVLELLLWMAATNEEWIRLHRPDCASGVCGHWWHGDLEDPNFVATVRAQLGWLPLDLVIS